MGRAVCLYGRRRQFFRTRLTDARVEKEVRRFRAALRLANRQLRDLGTKSNNDQRDNSFGILDFHQAILADEAFTNSIEQRILKEKVNAEWAVKLITDIYLAEYKNISDERLRERAIDLEDVAERILTALGGRRAENRMARNSVIVARELNPSTLIELAKNSPCAIVTEHGGWTSHTYILARELGITAVTGIGGVLRRIKSGDEVIVDGFSGEVVARPDVATKEDFEKTNLSGLTAAGEQKEAGELQTLDGRRIVLRVNADISGGYEKAIRDGAEGIGLFRSEYIFNRFRGLPNEAEQFEAYRHIALSAGEHGVRIRTFDLGVDDLIDHDLGKSKNPALGLRAIRLSLNREAEFRMQIRALLRAAFQTKIDIILPMISDIAEIRHSRQILEEERMQLLELGIQAGSPRFGVMIEVPSTVLLIDKILKEVDVLCLGTNDLVQYLLAVDRDNEAVAKYFNSLNPAIVRAIKTVIEAAGRHGIPCIVCGEMAGSPFYVPILIGLGVRELSMNPASISRVRRLVSGIAYEEAFLVAREVEKCDTAAEVEEVIKTHIEANWKHLFGAKATE
jgi:phosphotransferase system enzyme I (PtsI)